MGGLWEAPDGFKNYLSRTNIEHSISKDLSASHLILGKTHFPLIRYFSIDNFSLRRQVSILERKNANKGTLKDFYFLLFFRMAGDIMQP